MHDVGGPIGFLVATSRAERFRGLVITNSFAWPLRGYPAVRATLATVTSPLFGAINDVTNLLARATATSYGVGRHLSRADRRAFLGPWRARGPRRATLRVLASVLGIDEEMAAIERLLPAALGDAPVLTLFGRKNDPYGWQDRLQRMFPHAVADGIASGRHFPFNDDPPAYAEAIWSWWRGHVQAAEGRAGNDDSDRERSEVR